MDWMDVTRAESEGIKVWIALLGLALALAWRVLPRRRAMQALAALVLVAGLNYARWGPKVPLAAVDGYDVIHYYLNARYFPELGYYDLYPAAILADHENFGPYFEEGSKYMAQDETGHYFAPISHALARGREVKETRFTPERWRQFSHDFLYLQRSLPGLNSQLWRQLIQDHGFNGTLVWTLQASPFAQLPVEWIKALGYLDVVLLGVGVAALAWAFGAAPAWWAALFLFLSYSGRWPTYSSAFFRYDYLCALMLGMAAVGRGRPFWAGVATGWAAALRLFPALWLYGPATKGLADLVRGRPVRRHLALAGGFLLAVAALQAVAVGVFGTEAAVVHLENMSDHNEAENLSSRRIGLAVALPFRGDLLPKNISKETKARIEEQKPLRFALAGVVMVVLAFGLRNRRDEEAYAFGFLPFFLLTTASYYYYLARITLIVLHAFRIDRPKHTFGLAWLLGLEAFSNWAETHHPEHRVFLIGYLAWGLALYAAVMALWTVWESFQPGEAVEGVGDDQRVGSGEVAGAGAGGLEAGRP